MEVEVEANVDEAIDTLIVDRHGTLNLRVVEAQMTTAVRHLHAVEDPMIMEGRPLDERLTLISRWTAEEGWIDTAATRLIHTARVLAHVQSPLHNDARCGPHQDLAHGPSRLQSKDRENHPGDHPQHDTEVGEEAEARMDLETVVMIVQDTLQLEDLAHVQPEDTDIRRGVRLPLHPAIALQLYEKLRSMTGVPSHIQAQGQGVQIVVH